MHGTPLITTPPTFSCAPVKTPPNNGVELTADILADILTTGFFCGSTELNDPNEAKIFCEFISIILTAFEESEPDTDIIRVVSQYGAFTLLDHSEGVRLFCNDQHTFLHHLSLTQILHNSVVDVVENRANYLGSTFITAAQCIADNLEYFVISNCEVAIIKAMKHIANYFGSYSQEAINVAFKFIMNNKERFKDELIRQTALEVMKITGEPDFSGDFISNTARFIVHNGRFYDYEQILPVLPYVICDTECDWQKSSDDPVEYIISNEVVDSPIIYQCAVTYVIHHFADFPRAIVKLALEHVANNVQLYKKETIGLAAQCVVSHNISFFSAMNDQEGFERFYKSRDELETMQAYSDGFNQALTLAGLQFNYGNVAVPFRRMSDPYRLLYDLEGVLKNYSEVAQFVLNNREHNVLKLWEAEYDLKTEAEHDVEPTSEEVSLNSLS